MKKIYFPRNQRAFVKMGNVGSHPQFRHLEFPPEGYGFVTRQIGWREWFRLLPVAVSGWWQWLRTLTVVSHANGASWARALGFSMTRDLTRIVPAPNECAASFLPTFPFTQTNEPWFLEIEDVTTLFRPYAFNGRTSGASIRDSNMFPFVKSLLESPTCLGVLTHVKSTRDSVHKLFQSDLIAAKTEFIATPYVPRVEVSEAKLDELRGPEEITFFFNNSWHQYPANFYLRGGISILEAFEKLLKDKHPVRLILRSRLPKDLGIRFSGILEDPRVEVREGFMSQDDYLGLLRSSHYFLLPSARLHVVSLLESMYYGAVPIVSDGWGLQEYVEDGVTGLVVPGVYGTVSWVDEISGELREDYKPMLNAPGLVTEHLYQTILQQLNSPQSRASLALAGHRRVRDKHAVGDFNHQFKRFLDEGFERQ